MVDTNARGEGDIPTEDIEDLNAHGPYAMAVWSARGIQVGNEEGLRGRSAYFVQRIRETILGNFSLEQIKGLSIVDVGCNDGWVLYELSDLPFARMVGIEPREKNIAKGRKVREVLGVESRAEYRVGDVESLGDETFDIVICAGVLYHVESIPTALRMLRQACRRMLFIESRCMSSRHMTNEIQHEIEMRDLVYQYKRKMCGLTAQKFESSYHDGSARHYTVVNVPTVESLEMYLDVLGFDRIEVVAEPESYRAAVWKSKRPLGGVCLAAFLEGERDKGTTGSEEELWIRQYEAGLAETVLDRGLVEALYEHYCHGRPGGVRGLSVRLYLKSSGWLSKVFGSLVERQHSDKYEWEILKNLRYSPCDKLALEFGKVLYAAEDYEKAVSMLQGVTMKLNSDWRAVYRSFWLLHLALAKLGRHSDAQRYRELCLTCNPSYPTEVT